MIKHLFKSLLLVVLIPACLSAFSTQNFDIINFSILHTSDLHAHLMQWETPEGKTVGGYARIKNYKDSIEKQGREVLMLSSGDIFQGTFFYRFFQGIPDIEFMNDTGYAAMTLGNHEFDNGQEALAEALAYAKFPVLAANIQFKKIPALQVKIKPYTFAEVGPEGKKIKVAIVGLVPEELKTIVQPVFVNDFTVLDAAEALRRYLPEIKKAKPDMILLLSHLGWDRELQLFEEFPELDGILGGHTHLAIDPPAIVAGARGHRFMSQPGEWGQHLTRYDVTFYRNSNRPVEVTAAGLVPLDKSNHEDNKIAERVARLWTQIQEKVVTPVSETKVFLNGERGDVRNRETNLGNLLADCFKDLIPADMALVNGGGVRSSIATGVITVGDVLNVLPFDNYLMRLKMSGASINKVFAEVASFSGTSGGFGGFLQVSEGLHVDYTAGQQPKVLFNGKPLSATKLYTVTTIDFLAAGGNGLSGFTEAVDNESTGKMTADIFMKYLGQMQTVCPFTEGRIKTHSGAKKYKMPKGIVKSIPKPRFD